MSMDLNNILNISKEAAVIAGKFLKKIKTINVVNSSHGRDIKLIADIEAEKLIIKHLKTYSDFPILSEEHGKSGSLGEIFWVVDPLDGTANYTRDIPICCVSIALVKKNNPILGIIYDFNNDDLYEGCSQSDAMLNGKKISVSSIKSKSNGTLITGLPVNTDYSTSAIKKLISNFQEWKKVRMLGSAAMASAYIASGKADLYSESGTNIWDVAAGVAIVRAAGGYAKIDNLSTNFSLDICISNKCIQE